VKHSLHFRLMATTLSVCVLTAFFWAGWQATRMLQPDAGYWDSSLRDLAEHVAGAMPADLQGLLSTAAEMPDAAAGKSGSPEQRKVFQVWSADGKLLIRSPHAEQLRFAVIAAGSGPQFHTVSLQGDIWRVMSQWHPTERLLIQTAKPLSEMRRDFWTAAHKAVPVASLLILALTAGLWCAVRWSFSGTLVLKREIGSRKDFDLAPLRAEKLPTEMRPMVEAFNGLLARLELALQREQVFLSNAAHELRTPLAALRAQAQVLNACPPSPQWRTRWPS
jgi:two-component system, OmpR family, sensor histidine kinase QseC